MTMIDLFQIVKKLCLGLFRILMLKINLLKTSRFNAFLVFKMNILHRREKNQKRRFKIRHNLLLKWRPQINNQNQQLLAMIKVQLSRKKFNQALLMSLKILKFLITKKQKDQRLLQDSLKLMSRLQLQDLLKYRTLFKLSQKIDLTQDM